MDEFYLTHTCLKYMRPNTPHYVLTPQAAICHGGHFYAMSAIRDTVFGLYHMLALSNFITNVEHSQASCLLLQRLIMHTHNALVVGGVDAQFSQLPNPHVPNLATLEETLDLFSLSIFAELGEFLDPTAYKRQRRDVQVFEHDRRCEIHI